MPLAIQFGSFRFVVIDETIGRNQCSSATFRRPPVAARLGIGLVNYAGVMHTVHGTSLASENIEKHIPMTWLNFLHSL